MKVKFCTFIIFFLLGVCPTFPFEELFYQVIKIESPNTIYLDLNRDYKAQKQEKIKIQNVKNYIENPDIEKRAKELKISPEELFLLEYNNFQFARKKLLFKYVKVDFKNNCEVSIFYKENNELKDYCKEILKNNPPKIPLNLALLDKRKGIYYNLNSENYKKIAHPQIIDLDKYSKYYTSYDDYIKEQKNSSLIKNYDISTLKEGDIKLFYIDPTKFSRPKRNCQNDACLSVLSLIKNAKSEIKFAIYGYSGQQEILEALKEAQKRGVKVYGIIDKDVRNYNVYSETDILLKEIKNIKSDYAQDLKTNQKKLEKYEEQLKQDPLKEFDIRSAIMHNKFFIVDKNYLWTGSANLTENCLSYNANVSVLIKSSQIAKLYEAEFDQMYFEGKFHKLKTKNTLQNTNIKLNDKTTVSLFFSPQDKPITTQVIPLINNAKKYIYIPIFYLTHKGIIDSLIQASQRGVEIKVILDANSAGNYYSKHNLLRQNNIKVKTENWGGKMHAKSAIIDDKYIIVASMNWTNSAENINDENTLIIENSLLAQNFKQEFLYLWKTIPDKWLSKDPKPESDESVNSCFDGVDNNHNGSFDSDEYFCKNYF